MTPPAPLTQLPGTVTESLASTAAFAYPVACGSCGPLVPALAADAAPGPHAWAQPQSNVARVRESTLNRPQTARRVVLVVDDDACTTRALRRLLESVGYSVAVADGESEVLTKPFKMATLVERVNAAANRDHDHVRLDVGAFS